MQSRCFQIIIIYSNHKYLFNFIFNNNDVRHFHFNLYYYVYKERKKI